jgi:hypothetical protein
MINPDPFDVQAIQIPGAPEGVTMRAVMMTPEIASLWRLTSKARQRSKREAVSDAYARDMAEDRWLFNGETIVKDKNGNLLQGQHRLEGVEKSGKAVLMLLVEGVEPEVMPTFDTGLPRYYFDMLKVAGYSNVMAVSSITRAMWQWDRGRYMMVIAGGTERPSRAELDAYLAAHEDEIQAAAAYADRLKAVVPLPASVLGTATIILGRIDATAAAEFFNGLAYGADLGEDHPILVLRNQLTRTLRRREKPSVDERRALLFGTWNYWRNGEKRDKIQPWRGQLTSRNYPIPK